MSCMCVADQLTLGLRDLLGASCAMYHERYFVPPGTHFMRPRSVVFAKDSIAVPLNCFVEAVISWQSYIRCIVLLTKCRVVTFHAPGYRDNDDFVIYLNYAFHAKLQLHE